MKKINFTRTVVFSLHSWLGLITGIFLLLLGLSGSGIVFLKEIDHAINAKLLKVVPLEKPLPLDTFYREISRRHPNLTGISWLNPAAKPDEAYEFRLYQNDGKISTYDLGMVTINPYTAQILREGNLREFNPSLMYWLVQFHWSFQLGIPGLLAAAVFGITMLFSMLTGIVIYRKFIWKVLTFRVKMNLKNWSTTASSLHRIVGVWALAFNLVIFFTGFWMNKFAFDPAYWKRQTIAAPVNILSTKPIDSMLSVALSNMPDLIPQSISFPTQKEKNFKVSGPVRGQSPVFYSGNSVVISAVSGKLLSIDRLADKGFWEKVEETFFALHVGNFGGIPVKVMYVIIGLLPGLLSITGFILWWRKFKKSHN